MKRPDKRLARSHIVTIRVTADRPISRKQAQYAAWNAIHDQQLWGGGRDDPDEPYNHGRIKVRKS